MLSERTVVELKDIAGVARRLLGGLGNNALGPLNQSFADNAALKIGADGTPPEPPQVGEPLIFENKVTPIWPATGALA